MSAKKQTLVTVYDSEGPYSQYAESGPRPDDVVGFADWLGRQIALIPEEHRKEASIKITASEGYERGDYDIRFVIEYSRLETDGEAEARADRERALLNLKVFEEKRLLAGLLAKYGQDGVL